MASKNKYYAVKVGRVPGIYESWSECEAQVKGFPGAQHKGFPDKPAAVKYLKGPVVTQKELQIPRTNGIGASHINIYTDGSYNDKYKVYGWSYVVYNDDEEVEYYYGVGTDPGAAALQNVAGEMTAAMRVVNWINTNGADRINLYHDYTGISMWPHGEWDAKNQYTQAYARFMRPYIPHIVFVHVPGHKGIKGNERADELAARAIAEYITQLQEAAANG